MNPRTLRIFAVLAVIGLAVAWWAAGRGAPSSTETGAGEAFLPDFSARVNDVAALEIDDGVTPVRFEKRGVTWVDPARGGYPVQSEQIKRLLLGLRALEKREAKTARPERHAELKLATAGTADERGKVLKLWVAGQEAPAWELVIGESKWTPVRGVYARMAGDDQCWFVSGELDLPYQATAWLDKEVANANQQDVARIVLVRGEENFTITRPDDATPWALAELPEGRALKEFSPFGSLANVLGYLNFDDVAPASDERFARGPDAVAEFGFFHGGSIRLEGWKVGEGETPELWVRLASAPPTVEAPPEPPAEDGVEGPQAGPRGPSAATLSQWEAKWQGWVYKLPAHKATALLQDLDDWLEPLPEEPAAEDGTPAEAAPEDGVHEDGDGHDHTDD
jgi:hypothetical protein